MKTETTATVVDAPWHSMRPSIFPIEAACVWRSNRWKTGKPVSGIGKLIAKSIRSTPARSTSLGTSCMNAVEALECRM